MPRGTCQRWSTSANADSGAEMITTISTPRIRLLSAWKTIAAMTSPKASRTAL